MAKHEYAFDVKAQIIVRVKARSLKEATEFVTSIQCEELNRACESSPAVITELSVDDCGPHLFEYDGEQDEEKFPKK